MLDENRCCMNQEPTLHISFWKMTLFRYLPRKRDASIAKHCNFWINKRIYVCKHKCFIEMTKTFVLPIPYTSYVNWKWNALPWPQEHRGTDVWISTWLIFLAKIIPICCVQRIAPGVFNGHGAEGGLRTGKALMRVIHVLPIHLNGFAECTREVKEKWLVNFSTL